MLTRPQAEQLTAAIIDGITSVHALIKEAYDGKAHEALGYTSWPAYVEARFPLRTRTLPRQERMELVMELRSEGMSTRAIAPVVGVSQSTIRDDVQQLSRTTQTPTNVVSLDGRTRPARRPPAAVDEPLDTRVQRANEQTAAWLPTLQAFSDDIARTRARAAVLTTGDTRQDLIRSLRSLQQNIHVILHTIQERTP